MNHNPTELASQITRLAFELGTNPTEVSLAWKQLIPRIPYSQLPPLSERLESLLWCYLEDLLDEQGEAEFLEVAEKEPAILEHMQHIANTLAAAEAVHGAPKIAVHDSRLHHTPAADFVVVLGRDGQILGGPDSRYLSRSFSLARSGSQEPATSFDQEHLASFGIVRLIVDRDDQNCRVTFVFGATTISASTLDVEWRDASDQVLDRQRPRDNVVRFDPVSPGFYQFVFLEESSHRELNRLSLDIQCEEDPE